MKKLIVMLALALCCLLLTPALASASRPTLKSLAKSVAALQKKVNAQAKTLTSLSTKLTADEGTIASQGTTIASLSTKLTADEATIGSQGTTIAAQGTTLTSAAPLLAIAPYVSLHTAAMNGVAGPNVVFQGCNVHVRSTTSQSDTSGLGNLIVGWDDPAGGRGGSDNLVCGDYNSFSSIGCFVAGYENTVGGSYASVSGGSYGQATGSSSSISGGNYGSVSGLCSSISAGGANFASWGLSLTGNYEWAAGRSATEGVPKYSAP